MATTPNTIPTKRLATTIDGAATLIKLNNILDWSGTDLTSSDLGDILYAVLRNQDNSVIEIMQLDPTTIANNSTVGITILRRGLKFNGDLTTEVTGNKLVWVKNQTIVEIGTDTPQIFRNFVNILDNQTVAGVKTFSSLPSTSAGDPIAPTDLARKAYVDSVVAGIATAISEVVPGTAGETLAAGQLVYLKLADYRWWKADATSSATSENVLLGITQGSGTSGNAVTNGIMIRGVDVNQSGLTPGSVYYLTNTAGTISTTPGTKEVTVGVAKSVTELYFDPRFDQQLTEDQQDALMGTSGTPSSSNKYVTNDDTTGTGTVVRQSALSQGVSFPMAEAFTGATSPQPAVLIDDLNQNIFDTTTSFGAAGSPMVAIKTIPYTTLTVTNVASEMLRATDPGTNMTVEIQTDNAGVPSGTVITNGTSNTVATSTLNTYYKTMTFTFSTPPTLTAGTTYHFVFKTSATNANQITMLGLTNADKYANFVGSSNNGASWSSNAIVPVLNTTTVGASYSLWRADGDGKKLISGFHGFVITTGSAAASGTFVKSGVLSGFTGLTTGADYFVSNTIGTLTTTRQGCMVGKAVSSTQIDIVNSKFGQIIAITPAVTLLNNGSGTMISQSIKIPDNGFVMGTLNATYMNGQQYLGVSLAGAGVGGAYSDAASNGGGGWSSPCRKGDTLLFSQGVSGAGTSPSFGVVYFQSLQ